LKAWEALRGSREASSGASSGGGALEWSVHIGRARAAMAGGAELAGVGVSAREVRWGEG
jgi:hypothetical protein